MYLDKQTCSCHTPEVSLCALWLFPDQTSSWPLGGADSPAQFPLGPHRRQKLSRKRYKSKKNTSCTITSRLTSHEFFTELLTFVGVSLQYLLLLICTDLNYVWKMLKGDDESFRQLFSPIIIKFGRSVRLDKIQKSGWPIWAWKKNAFICWNRKVL